MIIGGIDFPNELINALQENKLVIFAGAGVSMSKPASLPNFQDLALEIAKGTGKVHNKNEDWDVFLGRLGIDDLEIQNKAAKITNIEKTKYTPVHLSIIKLFKNSARIKIVTTNFDFLFESASHSIWSTQPTIYNAPALPLGYDLEGIIHIHGTSHSPKSIVLTDKHFGKAYLTEGWARRFLVSLFENYTVLFVGYSHNDTVLRYLARALPDKSSTNRFALVGEHETKDIWYSLGIKPVEYPQRLSNDYSKLHVTLDKLREYCNRLPSDWQKKIWVIASDKPVRIDLEAKAILALMINDKSKAIFFTQKAIDPTWVEWLYANKILQITENSETSRIFIDWLTLNFVEKYPESILDLIGKLNYKINYYFWVSLVRKTCLLQDSLLFKKWFYILIQILPYNVDECFLGMLANASHRLQFFDCLLICYEKMATSRINFIKSPRIQINDASAKLRFELETISAHWNLNDIKETYIPFWINSNAKRILNVCVRLIEDRRKLHLAWSNTAEHDSDSWGRSAIEPHEQDKFKETIDVILETARDAVDYLNVNEPKFIELWIKNHENSCSFLIQRLTLYALNQSTQNPINKVTWVLSKGIFNTNYRHEIFILLKDNYQLLNNKIKRKLIHEIKKYRSKNKENKKVFSANEQFQWLSFLSESGECPLLQKEMDKIINAYPEITQREYPDLSFWLEDGYELKSPWSAHELLAKDSEEWFKQIIEFDESNQKEYSISALLQEISIATKEKFTWGLLFCKYLMKEQRFEKQYLARILMSFQTWPDTLEQAKDLLSIITTKETQKLYPQFIAEIIRKAFSNSTLTYMNEIIRTLNEIATSIWDLKELSPPPFKEASEDYYSAAINTTEGSLVEYWLHQIYYQNKTNNTFILNDEYKKELTQFCSLNNVKTRYTIPIICSEANYLYSLDDSWTKQYVLSLLGSSDKEHKKQAWDGFLASNRVSENLFFELQNEMQNILPEIYETLAGKVDRFIELYVALTFWYVKDANDCWLPTLFNVLDENGRLIFTRKMEFFIRNIKEEQLDEAWKKWIKVYWENRINGTPKPLKTETEAILDWLPFLNNNFEDAVEIALKMDSTNMIIDKLILDLSQENLSERYPDSTAKLITYLLTTGTINFIFDSLDKITRTLSHNLTNLDTKRELNEALIAIGKNPLG